jgi:ParB family transcriptional regulator, chromosome partitioning protein
VAEEGAQAAAEEEQGDEEQGDEEQGEEEQGEEEQGEEEQGEEEQAEEEQAEEEQGEEEQGEEEQGEEEQGEEEQGEEEQGEEEAEATADEGAEADDGDEYEEIELPESPEHKRTHPAPAHLAIERIDDDETFRFRPEGDVAALAMDIARLGQLFPVDVRLKRPDRFQLITGFRRLAALKFLQRDKVLARLHVDLSDDDAALIALAAAIHSQPVSRDELAAMRERLERRGRLSAAARDMIEKALAEDEGLAPEEVAGNEEEVDADELAADVATRLGQINQDLSLLADVFADLDATRRDTLLEQLKYSAQLVDYLEGGGEEES